MDEIVVDKTGRRLRLRKVGVLETLRLFKALGADLAVNEAYMGLASVASSVSMIDEVPLPFPTNETGVEYLLERLGDDGVDAVMAASRPLSQKQVVTEAGN